MWYHIQKPFLDRARVFVEVLFGNLYSSLPCLVLHLWVFCMQALLCGAPREATKAQLPLF